jgi:class 3 adenylate cyclase/tetratricopeptide (TPR) repeat protein/energy-coupling factor transporter ATP-binding protein EcfA2
MSIDITSWLRGVGLEQYATAFLENDIDSEILPELTADDLIGLGVTSIGHRRKLLAAIGLLRASSPISGASIPSTERVPRPGDADIAASSAERRQLTVMFCDLVGSTALASRLDPEDLREVLAAYHAVVAEVVVKFGGYIAKYMGDGVLAYFGYPQAHEHDGEQAARAGLALIDRVSRLESGTAVLASRVGIATGLVVVGDLVGSGEAQERGVVGETPNLAARLQEMAPANAVLVVESTRRLLGDLFDYRDLGAVVLKGFAEPVLASQVLSESTVENRFEALRSMTLSPLVGRDEEVQLLLRRWNQAKEGEGQIVLISGEAGIGKSRIVAALQERLEPERPIRLRYFCSPHRGDSALFPIIASLERAAGFARDDALEAKFDKLSALLCQSGDTDQETEAVFADLLSLPAGDRYPPLLDDPRLKRERILVALVRQLERLAQRRPILFLFEDAHWSDSTSLELLERLAERVRRLPVLMVVTFRPEFEAPWTGQAAVTSLTLSRLGQRATKALAGGVAGGKTLPAEILDRIIEHTDGIPLCIEELTKTLLEGTLLREADGQYVLSGPLPTLAIPSSLHDSLMARLDRLGTVKEVAQIGAAIGREFSYDTMKALAHRPDDRLRDELNQLVEAGLIFSRGGPGLTSFVFKHALVQDAAYGTLLRGRRQELHASIAKTLEERAVRPPGEEAPVGETVAPLAYHWLRAEVWDKALDYTLEAAEQARRLLARPEAINHYWQALELIERLPHTPELNRVHCNVILSLISLPGWVRDDQAETRLFRHVEEALKNATEFGQIANVARLEVLKGRHQDDEALLKSALVRAESSGDTSAEAFCANYYGLYLGQRGQFAASLGHIERAIEILGAEGNQLMQARTMVNGRCYSSRAGKLDQALVLAGRVRDIADALDSEELRAWRAWEAEPYFYRGLWDQTVLAAEEALPVAWEIGEWSAVFFSSAWLALAQLKLGQPDKARRVLDRVFKEAPARLYKTSVYAIPYAQIARAEVHLITGHHSEALSILRQALAASERGAFRLEEVAAHRVLGQVHEAMGDRVAAEAAFRLSLEVCEKMQCPPELAQTLLAYGRFRRGDNTQEDEVLIERALRLFEEMKATGWIEEARAALAATSPV